MNRRAFFKGLGAFMILAPATTYCRIWKAEKVVPSFQWTNEQLDLYNRLPYHLAEAEMSYRLIASQEAWKNLINHRLL